MVTTYPMSYSKAQTKKMLKQLVKENPSDPMVELQLNNQLGRPIKLEEIRTFMGCINLVVKGPAPPKPSKWYAHLSYNRDTEEWSVK